LRIVLKEWLDCQRVFSRAILREPTKSNAPAEITGPKLLWRIPATHELLCNEVFCVRIIPWHLCNRDHLQAELHEARNPQPLGRCLEDADNLFLGRIGRQYVGAIHPCLDVKQSWSKLNEVVVLVDEFRAATIEDKFKRLIGMRMANFSKDPLKGVRLKWRQRHLARLRL